MASRRSSRSFFRSGAALRAAVAVVLASGAQPAIGSAAAQAVLEDLPWLLRRADVYVSTRERWRGIRRNAQPWVQGDLVLGVRAGGFSLSAGAWGAVEPGRTHAEPRPDLRAGSLGLSAATGWVQATGSAGSLTVSFGALRDWFRRPGRDPAVSELYSTARLQRGRWSFAASAWHAVRGAHGTYLEPAIAFHHFVNPFSGPVVTWTSAVRTGFQAGPRDPAGGARVPGPAGTGLTHVSLSSAIRGAFPLGADVALLASLGPELQYGRDPAARARREGSRGPLLAFWWPIQLGLSYPVRRPE